MNICSGYETAPEASLWWIVDPCALLMLYLYQYSEVNGILDFSDTTVVVFLYALQKDRVEDAGSNPADNQKDYCADKRALYIYICKYRYRYMCIYTHIYSYTCIHIYLYTYDVYICIYIM